MPRAMRRLSGPLARVGTPMVPNESADRIVLTGTAGNGDRVDLVSYGDRSCGIAVNGLPDPGRQWAPCDVDESTLALVLALGLG